MATSSFVFFWRGCPREIEKIMRLKWEFMEIKENPRLLWSFSYFIRHKQVAGYNLREFWHRLISEDKNIRIIKVKRPIYNIAYPSTILHDNTHWSALSYST